MRTRRVRAILTRTAASAVLAAAAFTGVSALQATSAHASDCIGDRVMRCLDLKEGNGQLWAWAGIIDNGNDNFNYAVDIIQACIDDDCQPDQDGWLGWWDVADGAESPRKGCPPFGGTFDLKAQYRWTIDGQVTVSWRTIPVFC